MSHSQSIARPLLITANDVLLDDVLRLAAAAGVELEVCPDAASARRSWLSAPLCIIGMDAAAESAQALSERRPGVLLVGRDLDDASVWQLAVGVGADEVLFLPDAESALVDRLADASEGRQATAHVVCVVGGRGGAGASTLAASLAITGLRLGLRALLIDGDPLGGGIDLVLGAEDSAGFRWPDLSQARGRVRGSELRDALPAVDELVVLSWDRSDRLTVPVEAMRAVLSAARRDSDLVVIDLPRRLDEATVEAARQAAVTLLLVPAEVRATASAARVAAGLRLVAADIRVVVRGPAPSQLPAEIIADSLGLRLAGQMPAQPGLAECLERGEAPARRGRGPLAQFCADFLDDMFGGIARHVA